ncbi:hypothetical protein LIER_21759 [Lithospermum erythrorhizon]|uniref:NAC domain-containing protein n=1 Tax=Lithospermum erythrorhizon TaxID=34254 RepID=A0AAV3QRI9_LITER
MALPIGFVFLPSDEQLFKDYLIHKVTGHDELLPWDGIEERIMYGDNAEPWNVFHDADSWEETKESKKVKKSKYFFTQLRKVSGDGGKNFARSAGAGLWHGETGGDPKGDNIYGTKKLFSYKSKEGQDNSVKWLMHEYALSDRFLRSIGVSRANYYVLCKITKVIDLSKKTVYDDREQHGVFQENQDLCAKRKYMTGTSDDDNFLGQVEQEIKKARVGHHQDYYMKNLGSAELACKVHSDQEKCLEIEETILNQETTHNMVTTPPRQDSISTFVNMLANDFPRYGPQDDSHQVSVLDEVIYISCYNNRVDNELITDIGEQMSNCMQGVKIEEANNCDQEMRQIINHLFEEDDNLEDNNISPVMTNVDVKDFINMDWNRIIESIY